MDIPSSSQKSPSSDPLKSQLEGFKTTQLYREHMDREMAVLRKGMLDASFHNSTYADESKRLIGRFTSTIDTLNQILQKV